MLTQDQINAIQTSVNKLVADNDAATKAAAAKTAADAALAQAQTDNSSAAQAAVAADAQVSADAQALKSFFDGLGTPSTPPPAATGS